MSPTPYTTPHGATTYTEPAPNVPFYTPRQHPAGAAKNPSAPGLPTLFTPLTIRGVTLSNRFTVSPMCMYSADDGHMTDFHVVHLGQFALRGAGLVFTEATSVLPNGRISPEDVGLWKDSQVAPIRRVADFVHSQGHLIGSQLAHAGRKASTFSPFTRGISATGSVPGKAYSVRAEGGGWPDNIAGPSAVSYDDDFVAPHEASLDEIQELVAAFGAAARRAVEAGIDVIEIHAAHGYLLHEFFSPVSNKRTDKYGGSFENRTRILFEVIAAVRANVPDTLPLFVRVSTTDWLEKVLPAEQSWTLADTVRLAKLLPAAGVDLLDVSSGGNSPQQKIELRVAYQTDFAARVREALAADKTENKLLIGTVGFVMTPELARDAVAPAGSSSDAVGADLAFVGRQFLREPEYVLWSGHKLGVDIHVPLQYERSKWYTDNRDAVAKPPDSSLVHLFPPKPAAK